MKQLIFILLVLSCTHVLGQKTIKTNEPQNDFISFIDFVSQVENNSNIKLFFKREWIDTIYMKQSQTKFGVFKTLDEVFKNSKLSYYVQNENNIIITSNYKIIDKVPNSLFSGKVENKKMGIDSLNFSFFKSESVNQATKKKSEIIKIGNPAKKYIGKTAIIRGEITDTKTNEELIGVIVYINKLGIGTTSNQNGYYEFTVPKGNHRVSVRSIGKKEEIINIVVNEGGILDIQLEDDVQLLKDIIVNANRGKNINRVEQGLEVIDIKTLEKLPTIMGETDIIKSALLLPGVQTTGEGNSGINVRGGNVDQNLILFDGSPIYNSSHLFGFFSAFNQDVISDYKLYKSSFPANYGGRLSSIIDVSSKNGSMDEYHATGGISPLTGRLTIEGPIIKNKVSFLVAGRSTYSDWLLKRIESDVLQTSKASFSDLNAKINAKLGTKDDISVSSYASYDNFKLSSDTVYTYSNNNISATWKHSFSNFLKTNLRAIYSKYNYGINSDTSTMHNFNYDYDLQQLEAKFDIAYIFKANHKIKLGTNIIQYNTQPGILTNQGENSIIIPKKLRNEQGIEWAVFLNDEFNITENLSASIGIRYSEFRSLGPTTEYIYEENAPKSIETIIDSVIYNKNSYSAKYNNPELRISSRYKIDSRKSIKASYSNMTQYIHILSNTYAISPTDSWILSNGHIKPQQSTQYALGYYQNFLNNQIEVSAEAYYKEMKNLVEYKSGATLFLNQHIETDLLSGIGKSYGIELLIKKMRGKINGWMSYTYSRSLINVNGEFKEEQINKGKFYPTNYDKPHDITLVTNYKYSKRISLSATMVYNTGKPITYPESKYIFQNRELLHYSERNEYRVPDYFRIDLGLTVKGNLRTTKLAHSSWTFSVYNLTGRNNVYSIYFESTPEKYVRGYKMSVFAKPVPTITYNFKF